MIKDVVVHLTGSTEDAVRLRYANSLALASDAHLTGIYIHELPDIVSFTDPSGSIFLQELIETSNKAAEAVADRLRSRLDELGSHAELRQLDVYPNDVGNALAEETRTADVFVGTRPYGAPDKSAHIEEAVLLQSGRPCVFLPPGFELDAKFATILVGWKNTREATRAVAEALPLLRQANLVIVALVPEEGTTFGSEPGMDIGRYLSRHGVKAEIHLVPNAPAASTALLHEARTCCVDMIVMGGYGHSRLREFVLGGATRDVLSMSTIPVFMAH